MTDFELDQALQAIAIPEPRAGWGAEVRSRLQRKPWRRRLLIGGLAACAALGAAFHDNKIAQVSFGTPQAQVLITTRVEPLQAKVRWFGLGSGMRTSADWTMHYIYDRKSETVMGYETRVSGLARKRYKLEFRALSEDPRPYILGDAKHYRWIAPAEVPLAREVGLKEIVRVDLQDQLHDELEVVDGPSPTDQMYKAPLRVFGPTLLEDGKGVAADQQVALSGNSLVIYWPGEKSIRLRLDRGPKEDYVLVGWVEGAALEFDLDGHHYRLQSNEAIADGGRRPIYGLKRPDSEPKGPVFFGSMD